MESQKTAITLPLLYLVLGFLVGASFLSNRHSTNPEIRNVTVSYMYESEPGSAGGNNNVPLDSIQFYPEYIVINETNGGSRLMAVNRLRSFSFQPTVSK